MTTFPHDMGHAYSHSPNHFAAASLRNRGERACRRRAALMATAAAICLLWLAGTAQAQTGAIAGHTRDATGQALPGVTVQVASPALIEGSRTAVTDDRGLYRVPALPVGRYAVTFTLAGFGSVIRENVDVTSDFTASVVVDMSVGPIAQNVIVIADTAHVDLHNARAQQVFRGSDIADLPTARDVPGLLLLSPAVTSERRICNGGMGTFCFPTLPAFNSHTAANDVDGGLSQGRVLIDGMPVNSGRVNFEHGTANGLTLDTAAAQELTFTLSGGLGDAETGGATVNIVPRAGGNRFSGSYFTSYLHARFFDRNLSNQDIAVPFVADYLFDYDVNGSLGGPIVRNRLWFHFYAGDRGNEQYPSFGQTPGYANLNEGTFAANYVPDRARGPMTMRNEYIKANARLTFQPTPGHKFSFYWDEQSSCANPCYGMVQVMISPEAYWSRQTYPNRLMQLSWTNPSRNNLLFEAGVQYMSTHEDNTRHREFPNYRSIPRVCETGPTVGRDELAIRTPAAGFGLDTQSGLGSCRTEAINSGSLNYAFATVNDPDLNGLGPAALSNHDIYRSRGSASYVTGAHHARLGFDSVYYASRITNQVNDLRLNYHYQTPLTAGTWNAAARTGNCLASNADQFACGNMTLYYPEDQDNRGMLRPRPVGFEMNTGVGTLDERVWSGGLYLQDQWTLGRLSLSGAVRYDHAESRYGSSCIGPDLYVPVQADGTSGWCSTPAKGVRYNDLTPRWGVVWDVFGGGKTAIKWSMGKYLQAAGFSGLYVDDNPARRSTNALTRGWDDLNGNRLIDCDLNNPAPHTTPGGDFCATMLDSTGAPSQTFLTFGRSPAATQTPDVICGRTERGTAVVQAYCEEADQNLMSGWGKRRYEWQFGLGVQHELMPGVIGELTYNRRKYGNLTATDTVLRGCDYYGPKAAVEDYEACASRYLNYESELYDFYQAPVPIDSRLPDGGGYMIRGLPNQKAPGALPAGTGTVTLIRDDLEYAWNGVDTNISMRLLRGLRVSGGTTTSRAVRDTCFTAIDQPNVKGREGHDYAGGCRTRPDFQTNVRATASYTIPRLDVLVGTVFQYRPGVQRAANFTIFSDQVVWESSSANRTGGPFFTGSGVSTTQNINLLDPGDLYGEAVHLWDLKVGKNVRFGRTRLNLGVDVFNLFNNDTVIAYNDVYRRFRLADGSFVEDNPATPAVEVNQWGRPRDTVTARHFKLSIQFDF